MPSEVKQIFFIQNECRKRKINIVYQRIYVESRKMVNMNLFAGQEQKHRCREWTCGHSEEGEGGMNWEIRVDIYALPWVNS